MSDPQDPHPSSAPPPAGPEGDSGDEGYEVAAEHVRRVIAWYTAQIGAELRSAVPNQQRLEDLTTARQACQEDLRALDDAEAEDLARIASDYQERFIQLRQSPS